MRFSIHPWQRSDEDHVELSLPVLDMREVRSSNGQVEKRYAVSLDVTLAGRTITTVMTLSNRDEMGFRMLIGREALRARVPRRLLAVVRRRQAAPRRAAQELGQVARQRSLISQLLSFSPLHRSRLAFPLIESRPGPPTSRSLPRLPRMVSRPAPP